MPLTATVRRPAKPNAAAILGWVLVAFLVAALLVSGLQLGVSDAARVELSQMFGGAPKNVALVAATGLVVIAGWALVAWGATTLLSRLTRFRLLGVFGFAFVAGQLVNLVVWFAPLDNSDPGYYHLIASSLFNGIDLSQGNTALYLANHSHIATYSWLLAGVYRFFGEADWDLARLLNTVVAAAAAVLVHQLVTALSRSRRAPVAAAVCFAVFPLTLLLNVAANTDSPALFFNLAALLVVINTFHARPGRPDVLASKARTILRALAAGALAGLAACLRPDNLVLLVALVLVAGVVYLRRGADRTRLLWIGAFIVLTALAAIGVAAGVGATARSAYPVPISTSQTNYTLAAGFSYDPSNPRAAGTYNTELRAAEEQAYAKVYPNADAKDAQLAPYVARNIGYIAEHGLWGELFSNKAQSFLSEYPFVYAVFYNANASQLYPPEVHLGLDSKRFINTRDFFGNSDPKLARGVTWAVQALTVLVILGAVVAALRRSWRSSWDFGTLLLTTAAVGFLALYVFMVEVQARYSYATIVLLLVVAFAGWRRPNNAEIDQP